MLLYLIRRLLLMLPILLLVSIFTFGLVHFVPGDPAHVILGPEAPPDAIQALREKLGLDRPVYIQYLDWLGGALTGDLGKSLVDNRPVAGLIGQRLPATFELAVLTFVFSSIIAIPMGIIAAVRRGTVTDFGASLFAFAGLSIPNFWLGILLILLFSLKLRWLPATGYIPYSEGFAAHFLAMLMPAAATGIRQAATVARFMRSSLLDTLRADFVRTARAKGLSERVVILMHAVRNALIPVITASGAQVAALLGGLVITETIFTIPGFGSLLVGSIFTRDITVVQGCVLVSALVVMSINLMVDLLYSMVDPRIKLTGGGRA